MPDNTVNERFLRQRRMDRKLAGLLTATAATCWVVSYYSAAHTSWFAGAAFSDLWLGAAAVATFIGALGCTGGACVVGFGSLADEPPLPGSNY